MRFKVRSMFPMAIAILALAFGCVRASGPVRSNPSEKAIPQSRVRYYDTIPPDWKRPTRTPNARFHMRKKKKYRGTQWERDRVDMEF